MDFGDTTPTRLTTNQVLSPQNAKRFSGEGVGGRNNPPTTERVASLFWKYSMLRKDITGERLKKREKEKDGILQVA
jgi:hypothetical protein